MSSHERAPAEDPGLAVLLAEFSFVSGLIPLYRGVETRAVSALGLTVGAIATIFIALAEQPDANMGALSGILAVATWIFVLFTFIEVNASLRIKRAARYIEKELYPALRQFAPTAPLTWETLKPLELLAVSGDRRRHRVDNRLRAAMIVSGPLSLGIGLAGFAVGVAAIGVLLAANPWETMPGPAVAYCIIGITGGCVSALLGVYGYLVTLDVERQGT